MRTFQRLGVSFQASTDPRVSRLRRGAVIQIFELAGLGVVPGQFWQFLERTPAPGDAVINFLAALGLDPDLIRNGDSYEVDRANDLLDLLVDIDGAFGRLSDNARKEIQTAIWCGEYERVRDTVQIVRTYQLIVELGEEFSTEEERFSAFTSFLRDVQSELDNPIQAEKSDAEAADQIRLMMSSLLRRLADSRADHELLIKKLWAEQPDWKTSASGPEITLILSNLEATFGSIRSEAHPTDVIADLLSHLEKLNAELEATLASLASGRASGAHGSGSGRKKHDAGPAGSKWTTALKGALAYFGWTKKTLPTFAEFRAIKRHFQFKTHPDRGGTSEAFRDCMDQARIIEDYLAPA